jgi:hypothetical protein
MKNYIKKIIVGMFALVAICASQSAFASTWNGASNDCKSISIINATTNQGYQNPCWPLTSVSASAGDVINVRIYYHNTGSVTANNTRIVLSAPIGDSSTTQSFTGRIVSDQGSVSFGPVTANLSSSQSLSLSSVKWYTANTNETLTGLLNGQTGSEVLSDSGLDIGPITPGWSSQGGVVIAFKVSSNTVVVPPVTTVCLDSTASNYRISYPCVYPILVCRDTLATNYLGVLPCTYPIRICQDYSANNYGGLLPCTYNNTNYDYCTISSLTIDGSSYATTVDKNESVQIYWNTNGCTSATLTGPDFTSYSLDGSQYIYPQYSGTYTLSAYGNNSGTKTKSIYLTVDNNNNNYNTTPSVSAYAPTNVTTTSATLNGYVNGNGSYVNSWIEFPCNGSKYDNRYSQSYSTLSKTVYSLSPNTSYTYCVAAQNTNGVITRGNYVTFSTLGNAVVPVYVNNSNVVTTVATNITTNSATINGYITNPSYYNTNVYFEYGSTINLGLRTSSKSANGASVFNEYLSGLTPNTIYFFRAISEGSNGLSRGAVETFQTVGTNTTTNTITHTIIQGTTVVGTSSPIMLKIENRYQSIGEGDSVDYTITYKNIGKVTLTKPVLQVIIPKGITITNYTRGTYSSDTNTLTVPLEDLIAGAEGTVNVQAQVVTMPKDTAQIVSTAVLVYTNKNGAQENAMAYVLNTPKTISNSLLGASAFFGGIFPTSLVGWLLLIILILIIVLLARMFSKKQTTSSHSGEIH